MLDAALVAAGRSSCVALRHLRCGAVPRVSGYDTLDASLKTQGRVWQCTEPARPLFRASNDNNEVEMQRAHKGRRRPADPRQTDFLALLGDPAAELLQVPPAPAEEPGALQYDQRMRQLLNEAIKRCVLDRDEIAERVTRLVGRSITKAQIDAWTGASRPHRFPGDLIPAMCVVLGNVVLLEGLAEAAGCKLIERNELQLARLGQLWLFMQQAQDEMVAKAPTLRQAVARG